MSSNEGKQLFLLSRDHTPDDDAERSRITKNGGQVYQTPNVKMIQDEQGNMTK
jgi:hypothetical protein